MTDTALKFGPEWLRALSSGDGNSPPPSPDPLPSQRYKLAEHRYGREEMLALYHKGLKPPTSLVEFESLFVDKTQIPLALVNFTEEENRSWQRGINSDAVLKLMGRSPTASTTGGMRGARGAGSMDRGRGRARSVGGYGRGTGGYDEDEAHQRREASYGRGTGRGYDRDRAQSVADRGWDRNGSEEWPGASPRKDFTPRVTTDNWRSRDAPRQGEAGSEKSRWPEREQSSKDEDEGWKTAGRNVNEKWGRGGSGWREGGRGAHRVGEGEEGYRERRPFYGSDRGRGRHPREEWDEEDPRPSGGYSRKSYPSKTWDESSDIPEWAAEISKEKNGSFDATGAFRGDEDEGGAYYDEYSEEREDTREHTPVKIDLRKDPKSLEEVKLPSPVEEPSKALPPEQLKQEMSNQVQPERLDRTPGSPLKIHRVLGLPPNAGGESMANNRPPTQSKPPHQRDPSQSDRKRLTSEDEGLDRVADDLVSRLVEEDEERKKERTSPQQTDSWFYRDPQGQVQGPFRSSEMIEWFKGGYFPLTLQVRRACDERFSRLDELTKLWGRNPPFLPGPSPPPILENETPSPTESDPLSHLLLQQQFQHQQLQQQLLQQQVLQIRQSITAKLSQMEGWNSLTPLQQVQLIQQQTNNIQLPKPTFDPLLLQQSKMFGVSDGLRKDPLQSLLQQLQQNKPLLPDQSPGMPPNLAGLGKDPSQSFMSQMPTPLTHSASAGSLPKLATSKGDPIQSLLQQLAVPNGPSLPQNDRPWYFDAPRSQGAIPPSSGAPGMPMNLPGGLGWPHPGMLGLGSLPLLTSQGLQSGQQPSFWDAPGPVDDSKLKEFEELRRREEEKRIQEGERKKQDEQRLRDELLRLEDERKRLEEERRIFDDEKKRKEEEHRKKDEKQRKRMEEEKRKQEEEGKRLLEEKRLQEEKKRQQEEEKRRKQQEEEKRKKTEEDKKRKAAEEEKRRKEEEKRAAEEQRLREEEKRQQQLEEERLRREEEQQEAQREAFERLQDQQLAARQRALKSIAPWSPQVQQNEPNNDEHLSLAEIQERERKEAAKIEAQERRLRELQQQQAAVIAAAKAKQQKENAFKWGQKPPATHSSVKSLAEIQAEEAAELSRMEDRHRADRAALQSQLGFHQAGVWSGAAQSLSWGQMAKQTQLPEPASNGQGGGFWDDVPAVRTAPRPQVSPVKAVVQQQQSSQKKQKAVKEEETVKKIFEKSVQKATSNVDKFTQWCCEYLSKMNASIDIPTFVAFMKDVESAYEVNDYVRSYLGDGKESKEFAKQFIERRSKWRALQKGLLQAEDSIDAPARAANATNEFQEVKGKSRKGKKSTKKVDASSLLGFSVSGAPDRLNVGERDYGN